jgi:RNA polymerase sigma factor (sigma-70 family)
MEYKNSIAYHLVRSRKVAEGLPFVELVRKVRAGDESASAELVRRYEPAIRVLVRARLNPGLRRLLDSSDICQSVFANFFRRATDGEFELDRPERLIHLLATMARNRLTDHALRLRAARRDERRTEHAVDAAERLVDPDPSPSEIVARREMVQAIRDRLTGEERHLADQRALGRPWAEIAAELDARPDALRVRLDRAIDRISRELRLGN